MESITSSEDLRIKQFWDGYFETIRLSEFLKAYILGIKSTLDIL